MLTIKNFYVRVVGIDRELIPHANVSISPEYRDNSDSFDKAIPLKWDKQLNLFVTSVESEGTYILTVSANKLEEQSRKVDLPHAPTPEEVILGEKGMPYYYRGTVKTPFVPMDDFIGVSLNQNVKSAKTRVTAMIKEYGFAAQRTSKNIQLNNVLIVRFPSGTNIDRKQSFLDLLNKSDFVTNAGTVLESFKERVVFLTSQILVKFRSNITREEAESIARKLDLKVVRQVRYAGNAYLMEGVSTADYRLVQQANELAEFESVEYAEPNTITTSMLFTVNPADFLVAQQWHIPLIGLPDAWQVLRDENAMGVMPGDPGDLTYGDEDLVIAVADTGIQSATAMGVTTASHPDFQGNVTSGLSKVAAFYNFGTMVANNDGIGSDHGMGCAGVVSARADNPSTVVGETEGVAGVAGNCRVLGIVVPFGATNVRWADMLVWMAGLNPGWTADGVNYPMGTVFPALLATGASIHTNSTRIPDFALLDDALNFTATYGRDGRGMVSFLAAGNTAATLAHPANNTIADHDKVITIAASINTDVRSSYSCFDPRIDICAPSNGGGGQGAPGKVTADLIGSGNLAGQTGGPLNYRNNFGGTSSATPCAAGVGALILSMRPDLNWVQVREVLRNTAVKIDAANVDPIGQWTLDAGLNPVFSQWYGFGRVDAEAAVIGARDFDLGSDVVIRDNLADTGVVPSAGWHADSPDIWVRKTMDPIPVLAYGVAGPHENAERGQDNYVYLRVRNNGTVATNEVYLRAVICHYPGFEFRYPEEWQPTIPPSAAPPVPFAPGSYLIGTSLIDNLAPGADITVRIRWDQNLIPPATVMVGGMNVTWHPCILAEVSPHDGPAPAGATQDVKRYNDLAHKNIVIEDVFSGGFSTFAVVAGTADKVGVRSLILDRSGMSRSARVFAYCEDPKIMKIWQTAVKRGSFGPASDLPWNKCDDASAMTLLTSAKAEVDGNGATIELPAKTRIWAEQSDNKDHRPEVSIGEVDGQTVIFFDGAGASTLELPLPLKRNVFRGLVFGVKREKEGAFGSLLATQRRGDGDYSAGYEIRS